MEKMDHKYVCKGDGIFNVNTGLVVPEDEWIVFRAKDTAVPMMLEFYRQACKDLGCNNNHIRSIEDLINRVDNFQDKHPERCRVPD